MLYALICLFIYMLYIHVPHLAPACQNLVVFGHPKQMLEEAEEELATLPQLATEDMFITEHYFIMTSPYGNAIVPIQEILWIYKYSTLHKFLWYHFSISYTMHITAKKHLYIHCPKNIKSDIDGIMDYLAEANHDILVGFSEENLLKVEKVLGKPFHIEKLIAPTVEYLRLLAEGKPEHILYMLAKDIKDLSEPDEESEDTEDENLDSDNEEDNTEDNVEDVEEEEKLKILA